MNSIRRDVLVIDKCHTEKFLENIAFTHPPFPQKADCNAATAADLRMPMSIVKPKIPRLHTSRSGSAKSGIALLRSSHCAHLQAREARRTRFSANRSHPLRHTTNEHRIDENTGLL